MYRRGDRPEREARCTACIAPRVGAAARAARARAACVRCVRRGLSERCARQQQCRQAVLAGEARDPTPTAPSGTVPT